MLNAKILQEVICAIVKMDTTPETGSAVLEKVTHLFHSTQGEFLSANREKKKLDWLATSTDATITQSHSRIAKTRFGSV